MEKIKKTAKRWLCIALVLMLVGMIGASFVQTNGGKVTVKDLRWENTMGFQQSGLLFVPDGVSAENPAPAVVVSHGMFNNREMQDLNFVELSRRGFVVLAQDMPSHGNSDNVDNIGSILMGLYESVKVLDSLPYVDSSRIGITGHSLGGMSSNMAVTLDNFAPTQLVSAVLLNCADATYVDGEGNFYNDYGTRDVGILAAQYDEFFMTDVDANGNMTLPKDFVVNKNAQSFLYFGQDPTGKELRAAETVYTETIDGEECVRVIYNPAILHPWSHFCARSTVATISFFDMTLGAPNPIPATNQIWQLKVVFNTLGLIGFYIFLVALAIVLLFTPAFSSLRAAEVVEPRKLEGSGKGWFFGSMAVCAIVCSAIYLPIMLNANTFTTVSGGWAQSSPWGVSLWACCCGIVSIISMAVWYFAAGKKQGADLAALGMKKNLKTLGLTLVLALVVVAAAYGCVFVADYFFKVDFRIWVLAVKAFEVDKIITALFPCLPLFTVFYLASAVASNCCNYNDFGGKKWVNTALVCFATVFPAIILLLLQYIPYFSGSDMMFRDANMQIVWLFPMLVTLPVSVVISRKLYRLTNNPYLGGLINALIVTMVACSNTLTWG